jgi:hypothetical protein
MFVKFDPFIGSSLLVGLATSEMPGDAARFAWITSIGLAGNAVLT